MRIPFSERLVVEGLIKLKEELKREPTAHDINRCAYLPGARTIQRNGGLPLYRKKAGFSIMNHAMGKTRSKTASKALIRASKYEADLVNKMFTKHHDSKNFTKSVIRHFAYQQWLPDEKHYINIACDVAIDDREKGHVTMIDFFFPQDMYSFGGCVRSKVKKLKSHGVSLYDSTYSNELVCVNPEITQRMINGAKKYEGVEILSYDSFIKKYLE